VTTPSLPSVRPERLKHQEAGLTIIWVEENWSFRRCCCRKRGRDCCCCNSCHLCLVRCSPCKHVYTVRCFGNTWSIPRKCGNAVQSGGMSGSDGVAISGANVGSAVDVGCGCESKPWLVHFAGGGGSGLVYHIGRAIVSKPCRVNQRLHGSCFWCNLRIRIYPLSFFSFGPQNFVQWCAGQALSNTSHSSYVVWPSICKSSLPLKRCRCPACGHYRLFPLREASGDGWQQGPSEQLPGTHY